MVSVAESARRVRTRFTHRIASLPILALNVHTACNCRCVMCDIWKANSHKREISGEELESHLVQIRRLRVQRVMLTGGEPLLHRNLWQLCERLRDSGIRLTLVTTGLLIDQHHADLAALIDDLVVSIDGPPAVHDAIRGVRDGFARIERGLQVLANHAHRPRVTARCVLQRQNMTRVADTIAAVRAVAADQLSFLGADVSSSAFNRPQPWDAARRNEVALSRDQLPLFAAAIEEAVARCRSDIDSGFVAGGESALWRIYQYYSAVSGQSEFPRTRCNAPWVAAVLEPGGQVRPCFFHEPYFSSPATDLHEALNAPEAVAFRRLLDVNTDETCRRCVCTIAVSPWVEV